MLRISHVTSSGIPALAQQGTSLVFPIVPCTNLLQTILMVYSDEDYLGTDLITDHVLH